MFGPIGIFWAILGQKLTYSHNALKIFLEKLFPTKGIKN